MVRTESEGSVHCSVCNSPIKVGARFCGTCGTSVGTIALCEGCGAFNLANARLCIYCGYTTKLAKLCPACGIPHDKKAKFCRECASFFEVESADAIEETAPPVSNSPAVNIQIGQVPLGTDSKYFEWQRNSIGAERNSSKTTSNVLSNFWTEYRLVAVFIAGGLTVLSLAGAGLVFFIKSDDPDRGAASSRSTMESIQMYTTRQIFVRSKPTTSSPVIGRMTRGEHLAGHWVGGSGSSKWLNIDSGAYKGGFASGANLTEDRPLPLLKVLSQEMRLTSQGNLTTAPSPDAPSIDLLKAGTVVFAAGEIGEGWIEIQRKAGGVGYLPTRVFTKVTPMKSFPAETAAAPMSQNVEQKAAISPPTNAIYDCIQQSKTNSKATFIVDYVRETVMSPDHGNHGEVIRAQISSSSITWHAKQIRNWGIGGFNQQDMAIDRVTGQLTNRFSGGVTIYNCTTRY